MSVSVDMSRSEEMNADDMGQDATPDLPDLDRCNPDTFVSQCLEGGGYVTCGDEGEEIMECPVNETCQDVSGSPGCVLASSCLVNPNTECDRSYLYPGGNELTEAYQYGREIELSGDGLHMLVAAPVRGIANMNPSPSKVYYFSRSSTNEAFAFVREIENPNQDQDNEWGHAMAINQDGSKAVICEHRALPKGAGTEIMKGLCTILSLQSDSVNNRVFSNPEAQFYGSDVAISPDGQWLVVSARGDTSIAGKAFIYATSDLTEPVHTLEGGTGESFGTTLAAFWTVNDELTELDLVLGAPTLANQIIAGNAGVTGGVYRTVLTLSPDSTFTESMSLTRLAIPEPESTRELGRSLAFSQDGSFIAAGAPLSLDDNQKEVGKVVVYSKKAGENINTPDVILYENSLIPFRPHFGSAVYFDETDMLWIGARNHESQLDGEGNSDVKFNGEGRVTLYKRSMDKTWKNVAHIDGNFQNAGEQKTFDSLGTTILTFKQNKRVVLAVGGAYANESYKLSGQVTLFDVGTLDQLEAIE